MWGRYMGAGVIYVSEVCECSGRGVVVGVCVWESYVNTVGDVCLCRGDVYGRVM